MKRPHARSIVLVSTAAAALLALTACGGSVNDSSAGTVASDSAARAPDAKNPNGLAATEQGAPAAPESGGGNASGSQSSTAKPGSNAVSPASLRAAQQQLARRASVALEVKNINEAVAKVRSTTIAADGIVLAENIGTADKDAPLADSSQLTATTYGEITVSVPSSKLDAVVADLGSVGKVIRSTSSSEDVGSQIVDTQSRLETMRVSIERVRGYLANAKDLNQTVALEAELTRRQADLESMEAQLAALKDSVAMSPVQVSLTTRPEVIAPSCTTDDAGFLAGLKGGWKAFTASVQVVLTILCALLPFAVLFALVGVPAWLWWRRHRPARTAPAANATPSAG